MFNIVEVGTVIRHRTFDHFPYFRYLQKYNNFIMWFTVETMLQFRPVIPRQNYNLNPTPPIDKHCSLIMYINETYSLLPLDFCNQISVLISVCVSFGSCEEDTIDSSGGRV
jgi:hypothetical protein